ncbi:MAG: hypothetical protein JW873_01940 [Candidatus Saganbacteria bacterium]|nr:hypothetical protein [Candidatus Saganbacteria bacterium]
MAINNVQANAVGNTPNPQAYGLKSPQEAIDILSLVAIVAPNGRRNNVVVDQKDFGDPNLKAKAVVDFFKSAGLSPKELLALGGAIKRDLRYGNLKFDEASGRIEIPAEALTGKYLRLAKQLTDPLANIFDHTKTSERALAANTPAAAPEIKKEMLGNIGSGPQIDPASYQASVELRGNAFEAIATLFPKLGGLSAQAYRQEGLLKGAVAHA